MSDNDHSATTDTPALRFHHGAISVSSLERAIAWWNTMFGFTAESRVHLAHVPAQVAMLRKGPLRVELFEVPGAQAADPARRTPDEDLKTHGNKHFSFAVQDVDQVVAALQRKGADIALHKRLPFAAFAFVRDPDGNLVELIEQPDLWDSAAQDV